MIRLKWKKKLSMLTICLITNLHIPLIVICFSNCNIRPAEFLITIQLYIHTIEGLNGYATVKTIPFFV